MTTRLRLTAIAFAVLGLAALIAVLAIRVNDDDRLSASSTPGKWTQDEVAAFEEYAVYWPGADVGGVPLTQVIREVVDDDPASPHPTARDGFMLVYGDCDLDGADACPVPLVVRTTPRCFKPPELFPSYLQPNDTKTIGGGAVAQQIAGQQYVWTDDVTVTIQGRANLVDAAVKQLSRLNEAKFAVEPLLSAPVTAVCDKIQGRPRTDVLPTR